MRVLSRKEFLAMPSGTVYSRFDPNVVTGLEVKLDSIPDDWFYISFIGAVPGTDSGEVDSNLTVMESEDVKIDPFQIRDGLFDMDAQFITYTKYDVEEIVRILLNK